MKYKTLYDIFGSAELLCISPKTKQTTEELKEQHYQVNRVLFAFKYIKISPTAAEWLFCYLKQTAEKMKAMEFRSGKKGEYNKKDSAANKRDEIVDIMRQQALLLRDYKPETDKEENARVINYLFSKELKDHKTGKFDKTEDLVRQLKFNALYHRLYPTDDEKIAKFIEFQNELCDTLGNKYRFNNN